MNHATRYLGIEQLRTGSSDDEKLWKDGWTVFPDHTFLYGPGPIPYPAKAGGSPEPVVVGCIIYESFLEDDSHKSGFLFESHEIQTGDVPKPQSSSLRMVGEAN
jgi:hypothetical protein